jgi:peptidoglycan/LPS O-acetylase OafA/YrhL
MKPRTEIDGLRAVAVIPVLLYHAGLGFPGGYVGVDVFFVISGYLITALMLRDLEAGEFRLANFWERRVRRIFPALVVMVLAVLAAGWFLFLPDAFENLASSVIAQIMLSSNVHFLRESGYFAASSELQPLLHTWSLAVEEQFYLLLPFVLPALYRRGRKILAASLAMFALGSFVLSVYGSHAAPSATFYLLPTRAWELLLGAWLASISRQPSQAGALREFLSWGGLLAILASMFLYDHHTLFPGLAAALPCVGTALVIWANSGGLTSVGRLLSLRPLVFTGLISYSLYLWHWPLLAFWKYWTNGQDTVAQRAFLLLICMPIAIASWRFVETPFRQRSCLRNRSQVFAFAAGTTVFLLLASLAIQQTHGLPSRIPPEVRQYAAGATNHAFRHQVTLRQAREGEFVELGRGNKTQPVQLLVWGDSHAMSVMPAFDALCREHGVRGVGATHSATAPLIGYISDNGYSLRGESVDYNDAVASFIRRERVRDVVLVANWTYYTSTVGLEDGVSRVRRGLGETVAALKKSGVRIWLMKEVPQHRGNVPQALAHAVFLGRDPHGVGLPLDEHQRFVRLQDLSLDGLDKLGVVVLDPIDLFATPAGLCVAAREGRALYWDSGHLSVDGAMHLRTLFKSIFEGREASRLAVRPADNTPD